MPPERKTAIERQREERESAFITETGAAFSLAPLQETPVILRIASRRLRAWGELATDLKRAGWKAKATECDSAAALVDALAVIVEQYEPQDNSVKRPEQPEQPERPHPGIDVVGNPNATVADVEQRLTNAFGPELSARKASIESEVDGTPGAVTHLTIGPDGAYANVTCGAVLGVNDGENCARPFGHDGDHALTLTCSMGPGCEMHPGIEVVHPTNAPVDAVVGPEGGSERLPRDEDPDPVVTQPLPPAMNTTQDHTVTERIIGTGEFPPERFQMPALSDAGPARTARPRLTYAELYQRKAHEAPADYRSVSQINTAAECGVRFALYREPEREPAWWNVAGTALHACIERFETTVILNDSVTQAAHILPAHVAWLPTFFAEIERQREASGVPVTAWRAARGGTEGYDWWRVNGEEFLKAYVVWSQARHAAGWSILSIADTPVIEFPFALDVHGIRVDGVIDQAWGRPGPVHTDSTAHVEIIDLKFGSSRPADRFQIGVYAHALAVAMGLTGAPAVQIGGAYYLGRKSELYGRADDLREVVPWDDVIHRTWMSESMSRAGIFMPHRSNLCKACPVNDLCPAGAS